MEKLFLYVEKRNIFPWFSQMVHLHFLTLWFVIRKCHGYGSKPWEFWVKSMALTGRNPQGFGVEAWCLWFINIATHFCTTHTANSYSIPLYKHYRITAQKKETQLLVSPTKCKIMNCIIFLLPSIWRSCQPGVLPHVDWL